MKAIQCRCRCRANMLGSENRSVTSADRQSTFPTILTGIYEESPRCVRIECLLIQIAAAHDSAGVALCPGAHNLEVVRHAGRGGPVMNPLRFGVIDQLRSEHRSLYRPYSGAFALMAVVEAVFRWLWPVTNQVTTAPDNRRPSTTCPDTGIPLNCSDPTQCDTARRCWPAW